ncbi:hypothetical protein BDN70DRAFT_930596 [Pholiota conissans]|uniref:Uncharacterized protein n=1 Tax=Pholiota conissans TaxID=109636 RepID=A0A9P6D2T7_9AGAR|nr:hypothetical protein BDN70DRAFT_930596 [Pholiota conissans]
MFKLKCPLRAIRTPLRCPSVFPQRRPIYLPPVSPSTLSVDAFHEDLLSWSASDGHQLQDIVVTEIYLLKERHTLARHEYACARVEYHLDNRIKVQFVCIERKRGEFLVNRTSFLGSIERAVAATSPSLSIFGDATPVDVVSLLDREKRRKSDVLHRTLRFTNPIPLIRVIALANMLHVNHDRYRLFGENCYLFAGEICDVLEADTDPRYPVQCLSVVPGAGYRPPFVTYPTIINEVRIQIFTELFYQVVEVENARRNSLHATCVTTNTNDSEEGHKPQNLDGQVDCLFVLFGRDKDDPANAETIEAVRRLLIAARTDAIDKFIHKKKQSVAEHRDAPYDPSSLCGSLPSFSF